MVGNITFLMIFCGFWSVAVNTMDKLQFLVLMLVKRDRLQVMFTLRAQNYKLYFILLLLWLLHF